MVNTEIRLMSRTDAPLLPSKNVDGGDSCSHDDSTVQLSLFDSSESLSSEESQSCLSQSFMGRQDPSNVSRRPQLTRKLVRFQGARNVLSLGDEFVDDESLQLIRNVDHLMENFANQERHIRKSLRVHMDKARARLDCENTMGAVLSMRKVHKLQADQARVLDAIGELRTLEIEVESQFWESWKKNGGHEQHHMNKLGRRLSTHSGSLTLSKGSHEWNKVGRRLSINGSGTYNVNDFELRLHNILCNVEGEGEGSPSVPADQELLYRLVSTKN